MRLFLFAISSAWVFSATYFAEQAPVSTNERDLGTRLEQHPFSIGEKISYELVYNWGIIWASAGYVDFEVRKPTLPNAAYQFHSYGSSYKKWDWFYKVRSTYESEVDDNLSPLLFKRHGKEGSHYYNRYYEAKEGGFLYVNHENEEEPWSKHISTPPSTFDVISGVYHCRNLDFSKLNVDDKLPLRLMLDGEVFDTYLRYKGKTQWKDERTGIIHDCIVFKPKLIEGTVFSEGENMTVYVSDDEKRIPVYIETELVVGKAKVYLK